MDITPFTIEVADAVLDDLYRRLETTRWPGEIPGVRLGLRHQPGLCAGVGGLLAHPL
jgi:hypothetical protein